MNTTFDSFFRFIGRYIIFIPIVILIIGLIVRFGFKDVRTQVASKSISAIPTGGLNTSLLSFNLMGPLSCAGTIDRGTYMVYIANGTGSATLQLDKKTIELRLLNDCVYFWTVGLIQGTKICNVSSYLAFIQSSPLIGQIMINSLPGKPNMVGLLQSCEKKEKSIAPVSIPESIQFDERNLTQ